MNNTATAAITEPRRLPELLGLADRQHIFRRCLSALAEPGTRHRLTEAAEAPGSGDPQPTGDPGGVAVPAAPVLVLADLMTPIAAAPGDADAAEEIARVASITHAPLGTLDSARFVLARVPLVPEALLRLHRGTPMRPHRATMLCQSVLGFDAATQDAAEALTLRLSGPGVPGEREVRVLGLPEDFFAARAEAVADFPCGIDILLIDSDGEVLGLPRTTRIEVSR